MKDNNCENFINLIEFLRQFKSKNKTDNLRIILITNAVLLTPQVINYLVGVVDRVTVTIDAYDDIILPLYILFVGKGKVRWLNFLYFYRNIVKKYSNFCHYNGFNLLYFCQK